MKQYFFSFITLIFLSFLSCSNTTVPVYGAWETDCTLQSELGSESVQSEPVAYLFSKQHIRYTFNEDGTYTQQVVQTVDRVEFVDSTQQEHIAAAKDYFAQYFNKTLIFTGSYRQQRARIFFTVDTVQSGDAMPVSYDEFYAQDSSIGAEMFSVPYELVQDELILNGLAYHVVQ